MVKGKRRAGKGAARKAAGKPKPRKRAARKSAPKPGMGHNKPPREPVPHQATPDITAFWNMADQTAAQVVRDTAARQRAFRAATRSGPVAPPFALAHDPSVLHAAMLKRVSALEETTAKLLISGEGQVKPRPLDDSDLDEIKSEIETLKKLPPVPAKPPTEAVGAQSRLAKFGEKVLVGLTTTAVSEASKTLWALYADQLIALARAIGEWIASLPPPP
jgi:hypothetical protein